MYLFTNIINITILLIVIIWSLLILIDRIDNFRKNKRNVRADAIQYRLDQALEVVHEIDSKEVKTEFIQDLLADLSDGCTPDQWYVENWVDNYNIQNPENKTEIKLK